MALRFLVLVLFLSVACIGAISGAIQLTVLWGVILGICWALSVLGLIIAARHDAAAATKTQEE